MASGKIHPIVTPKDIDTNLVIIHVILWESMGLPMHNSLSNMNNVAVYENQMSCKAQDETLTFS